MSVFPQLDSGAIAQTPFRCAHEYRTTIFRAEDGSEQRFQSPNAHAVRWQLSYTDISESESARLEQLFAETQGQAAGFTFLDPMSNLLASTQDLLGPVWTPSNLSSVTPGSADPEGGTEAWQLVAGGPGAELAQTVAGPADFVYSGSCWIRTTAENTSVIVSDGAGATRVSAAPADGAWHRVDVRYDAQSVASSVRFSIGLEPGASAEIYGPQFEAQPGASSYKPTAGRGGVFTNTHFDTNSITKGQGDAQSRAVTVNLIWTPSQS